MTAPAPVTLHALDEIAPAGVDVGLLGDPIPVPREGARLGHYLIRAINVDEVREAIAAAAAKVARRITTLDVHVYTDTHKTRDGEDPTWCETHRTFYCRAAEDAGQWEYVARCYTAPAAAVDVEIYATGLPMFDGAWGVAGILTRDTVGVIVATTIGGDEADDMFAAHHRALMGECAHCNKIRARNTTVLLFNDDTADIRPVGKSCLTEYTGGAINASVLPELTSLGERFATACGGVIESFEATAPTVDVVALAARYIEIEGYRRSDSYPETPTAHRIRYALSWNGENGPKPSVQVSDLTVADRVKAADMIAAVLALPADSSYMDNLHAAASVDWTQFTGRRNRVGFLASLPGAAQRAVEKAARDAEREAARAGQVNAYIGVEKQRREFTGVVRVAKEIAMESYLGGTEYKPLLIIHTPEGVVKFLGTISGPVAVDLDTVVGKTVTLTGTITKHEEYQGVRQTRINRIKVTALTA